MVLMSYGQYILLYKHYFIYNSFKCVLQQGNNFHGALWRHTRDKHIELSY